jgi:hypothetical protein
LTRCSVDVRCGSLQVNAAFERHIREALGDSITLREGEKRHAAIMKDFEMDIKWIFSGDARDNFIFVGDVKDDPEHGIEDEHMRITR